jgi:adenylate kinase
VGRVCGGETLTARADDQDEDAIDKRHGIYYDAKTGSLAAVNYFKERTKVIGVDGTAGVKEVSEDLLKKLGKPVPPPVWKHRPSRPPGGLFFLACIMVL